MGGNHAEAHVPMAATPATTMPPMSHLGSVRSVSRRAAIEPTTGPRSPR
jgi:hypothetical protein